MSTLEERPLFGEEKREIKWMLWGSVFVMAVIIIFSTTVGIVFGVIHKIPQHIMLAGCLVCLSLVQAILLRWYRNGELEGKYFWFQIGLAIVVILICVTINAYVWPYEKCEAQPQCTSGLWDTERRQCVLSGIFACGSRGQCVQASRSQEIAQCCNCTMSTCQAAPTGANIAFTQPLPYTYAKRQRLP
jgi:hypothetical protein